MFHFERTQRSVLAICTQCGSREVFSHVGGQAAADRWALAHVETAHPGPSPEQEAFFRNARVRAHRRGR